MVRRLDTQPLEVLREHVRLVHPSAPVRIPRGGRPELQVIREPTITAWSFQLREGAKHGGHDHPTLSVKLDLERRPVQEALEDRGHWRR